MSTTRDYSAFQVSIAELIGDPARVYGRDYLDTYSIIATFPFAYGDPIAIDKYYNDIRSIVPDARVKLTIEAEPGKKVIARVTATFDKRDAADGL